MARKKRSQNQGEVASSDWLDDLEKLVKDLEADEKLAPPASSSDRRRSSIGLSASDKIQLTVVERDGVIRFTDSGPRKRFIPLDGRRGNREPADSDASDDIVQREIEFESLPPSQVYSALEAVDFRLTPFASGIDQKGGIQSTGLRRWTGQKSNLEIVDRPTAKKNQRILLFIHGTFSNNDNFLQDLNKTKAGRQLLDTAKGHYHEVLGFDHRTLGMSPILNAKELSVLFSGNSSSVDIICHSRGGLVARWWAEAFDRQSARQRRVVFVGSPLEGTGLAAPPNIRHTIDLLGNFSNALSEASGLASYAVPVLTVATTLFKIVGTISKGIASVPIVDAAVALVPGLDAMSRVGNNHEIMALSRSILPRDRDNYFVIQSNFETEAIGWKFWRAFRDIGDRTFDGLADTVFTGHNDLVVDTPSMSRFSPGFELDPDSILDFGTNSKVHHLNYFRNAEALEFIKAKLMS